MVEVPAIPKKAYMSKTMWANLLMALVALVGAWVPRVPEIVSPEMVAMIFAGVNMILRLVTKDKLVLW